MHLPSNFIKSPKNLIKMQQHPKNFNKYPNYFNNTAWRAYFGLNLLYLIMKGEL